jgi:Gly-Xaa carboxypeptidase
MHVCIQQFNLMNLHSHAAMEPTTVNYYGLIYHWQGSDASLKPLLLAAHQGASSKYLPSLVRLANIDRQTLSQWQLTPLMTGRTHLTRDTSMVCADEILLVEVTSSIPVNFTGNSIWGRGSVDDKSGLIGTL